MLNSGLITKIQAKGGERYKLNVPPKNTLIFASRLVNTDQENAMRETGATVPINEHDKRIYLPQAGEEGKEIYKGLKCRLAIPIPQDSKDFAARYHRNLYTHMEYGTGTLSELEYLNLCEINYTTKAK